MDIGSILFIFGLFVLVALFISRPFFERKAYPVTRQEHDYSALLADYERVLVNLQDLEFDHTMGKIPEDEYPARRQQMMLKGADLLRQIDEIETQVVGSKDARFEAAIQARRAQKPRPLPAVNGDDDLEALIAARRRARQEEGQAKSSAFCPQCAGVVRAGDRFCPQCGAVLD
ncbi:MAG: zinc ribbon domain-containing protein [Anaerolineales bacterium]|nr:zinc ribbon domain-containing protein [Anaerolineales bacterium]